MTRRYGRMVYEVAAYCSPDSKATYEDRLLQLIRHARRKNPRRNSCRMMIQSKLHFPFTFRHSAPEVTRAMERFMHKIRKRISRFVGVDPVMGTSDVENTVFRHGHYAYDHEPMLAQCHGIPGQVVPYRRRPQGVQPGQDLR